MANRNALDDVYDPFADDVPARQVDVPPRRTMLDVQQRTAGVVQGSIARPATPKGLSVRGQQPASAIVPTSDGRVALGRLGLTKTGLVIPDDITVDEWRQARDMLIHWDDAVQWWLGDMLAHGEREYREGYRVIAAQIGKDVKTLRNYVYVANKVQMSLRRDKLSFGHHMLVAAMAPEDQNAWLDYAERLELSVSEMRTAIQGEKPPTPAAAMPSEVKSHLVFLSSLNGVPYDRAAKEELRQRIHAAREWLDELEGQLR